MLSVNKSYSANRNRPKKQSDQVLLLFKQEFWDIFSFLSLYEESIISLFHAFVSSFKKNITLKKKKTFRKTIRVSNSLNPDLRPEVCRS